MDRNNPKPQQAYGYYNFGRLQGVQRTRHEAIKEVERNTGDPWHLAKEYIEVHKVMVVPAKDPT